MGRSVTCSRKVRSRHLILVKSEKGPRGRTVREWEDNIKQD
jgi:hypothetical protein